MKVGDEHAGARIKCPGCGMQTVVPGAKVTESQKDLASGEMWRVKELRTLAAVEDDADYRFRCMAIAPSGKFAVTGSRSPGCNGRALRFWNLPEACEMEDFGQECEDLLCGMRHVQAVAFSADGKRLACAATVEGGKRILVFTVGDTLTPHAFEAGRELDVNGEIHGVCFSRDGRFVASCGREGISIWGMKSGKEYHNFQTPARSLAFSPDGKYLAAGELGDPDADWCDIMLWRLDTGKIIERFRGHTDWINAVVFAPDGKHLLSASGGDPQLGKNEYSVRLWEVGASEMRRFFDGYIGRVATLAFTQDGNHFIAAGLEFREKYYGSASDLIDGKPPCEKWIFAHVRRILDGKVLGHYEKKEKNRGIAPGDPREYAFTASPTGKLLLIAPEKPEMRLFKAVP